MQKITHQPCFLIRDIKLQYSLNHCTTCIFSFFKLIIFLLLSFRKRKTASMSRWFRKKAMINISLELFQDEYLFHIIIGLGGWHHFLFGCGPCRFWNGLWVIFLPHFLRPNPRHFGGDFREKQTQQETLLFTELLPCTKTDSKI